MRRVSRSMSESVIGVIDPVAAAWMRGGFDRGGWGPLGDPTHGQKPASPPLGSTGGKMTLSVGEGLKSLVDWFNCTFLSERLPEVVDLVDALLGPGKAGLGRHTYREGIAWDGGAGLYSSPGRAEAMLSLNGASIKVMGQVQLYGLLCRLQSMGCNCTRLDTTVDDESRRVEVRDVELAARAGNFAGYRRVSIHEDLGFVKGKGTPAGASVRFGRIGKDGSGCSPMVYDKALESGGENPSVRWEVRWSKDGAKVAWICLMQDGPDRLDSFARRIASLVRSAFSFVDRSSADRLDRMQPLSWWAVFSELLGRAAELVIDRVKPALQRTLQAFAQQFSAPIGYLVDLYGPDFVDLLIARCWQAGKRLDTRRYGADVSVDVDLAFAGRLGAIP